MKPERTQIFAGPLHLDTARVRFTVGGIAMKPERTQLFVNGVAMKPERTQLSISCAAFQPKRLQATVALFTDAVRFVGHGNFGQALEAFRAGCQEVRGLVNDLVQVEIELVPVAGEKQ